VVDAVGDEPAGSVDVSVPLDDTVVAGTVTGVRGSTLLCATYSSLGPRQRIAGWVRLLAVAADGRWPTVCALTIGRKGTRALAARIGPIDAAEATAHLRTVVDLYTRGMREPLPLWCRTSESLARRGPARLEWETSPGATFPNEDRDRDHVFVLGSDVPLSRLLAATPRPDEDGPGWTTDPGRAARYAHRLWDPLLAVEELDP
jgi:exodeoxyribonuclease V gamma subunit